MRRVASIESRDRAWADNLYMAMIAMTRKAGVSSTLRGRDSHEAYVCDESWLAVIGSRVGGSLELDGSTTPNQWDKCMYIHARGKEDSATPLRVPRC